METSLAFTTILITFQIFFRSASYSGEMDAKISTEPLTSYYGDNVCELIRIKRIWDPQEFFTNPFSIPASVPDDMGCS